MLRKLAVAILALSLLPTRAFAVGTFRENPTRHDSQLDAGYQSVSQETQWKILAKGNSTVAVGMGGLPYQFVFSDMTTGKDLVSTMVAGAFPTTADTYLFYDDWGSTVRNMSEVLHSLVGDAVNFESYDQIYGIDGNTYLYYFELYNGGELVSVTMAWRFQKSYYMAAMGVNLGDMPEMFTVTRDAALRFRDETSTPLSGYQQVVYTGEQGVGVPHWAYPVTNPFWAFCEYFGLDEG